MRLGAAVIQYSLIGKPPEKESLTRNIGAGLAIISRDYKTIWANEVVKNLFGEVEEEVLLEEVNNKPQSDVVPK